MPLSSSSNSDGDDDREMLRRILAKTGTSAIEIPNDADSDSDSSGSDVLGWFRQIQEKFSINSDGPDPFPVIKPLSSVAPSDSDDDDVMETMAAIHRRFDQYENDVMKDQDQIVMQETDTAVTYITSRQEISDILSKDLNCTDQLRNPSFTGSHQLVDISGDVPVKALTYSQFPKSAQNFVSALKKNRSCQRFIRRKLIEIEAKIEENKRLKERIKCLMDFQLSCKKKVGRIICQKKDPRVRLISMQKQRTSKTMKGESATKIPALYYGPPENFHVSNYKMVLKRFPLPFKKQHWSVVEKENLAKGLKQQYQEMLLLNSMNLESDLESSMNPDMMSAILSNDLEVTPEKIRSFLPLVNWDRLASMYVSVRSGPECESRWLNCEDPLINYSPWTILEDKKLLLIVQERGIYNWIDIAIMLGTQRTPFQCLARYQRSLNPHILNKNWTEDEDFMLRTAVEVFGEHNWQLVASNLEGRTGSQCSNRWLKTLNPERRKVGRWSVDEDKRLKVAVMLFGAKNWRKIACFAPGRTQVQCRERWLNCLDPSLKLEAWTTEEDDKLKAAIDEHGYSWSKVATCVPPRTDNQCMRRWKYLFPEEVPLLREARRLKKTVLISNFVDRESERPLIGPGDFSSLISTPAECGNSSKGSKKRSREGADREKQRELSRNKKSKKSRANSRRCSEENMTGDTSLNSGEAPFTDLSLVPAEPGVSTNNAENGTTRRRRKRVSRGNQPNNSAVNSMETQDESVTANSTLCTTSVASHNQPDESGRMSRQPLDVLPAYSTVNSSEVDPPGLSIGHSIDTGEIGNASETIPGTSRCSMNIAKDMNQSSITDLKVSECFDEDVPLISWMKSLAVAAKSKRSSNKSSSRPGMISQKEVLS